MNPHPSLIIVTLLGEQLQLTKNCLGLPIATLHDYLVKIDDFLDATL